MKNYKLIVIVGLLFSFSANAGISDVFYDLAVKVVGEEKANSIFGREPKVIEVPPVELPTIPRVMKQNTNANIKTPDFWNKQGADFEKLKPEDKRKYDLAFLRELFVATRKAEATDSDLSMWINVLEQGGSREGVYRALVLDEVYSTLEGYEEVPTDAAIKFTRKYCQKFLRQDFKDEVLKKMNIFMIKRIITEKTLEVIEVYEHMPEDLFKWYAVFSADLAKDGEKVFQTPIRLEKDSHKQLSWAKKVPLQHIKSEVILKLHLMFNSFK